VRKRVRLSSFRSDLRVLTTGPGVTRKRALWSIYVWRDSRRCERDRGKGKGWLPTKREPIEEMFAKVGRDSKVRERFQEIDCSRKHYSRKG